MKHTLILCLLLACGSFANGQIPFLADFRTGDPGTESWNCIGPLTDFYDFNLETQGRVNAIWVNPTDSNTILIGSDAGGLWKSNNDGHTWRNLTDNIMTGTSKILGMQGMWLHM